MVELVEFLKQRLTEDDERAYLASTGERWESTRVYDGLYALDFKPSLPEAGPPHGRCLGSWENPADVRVGQEQADYIVRFDPARVRAEVAAKRALLELHQTQEQKPYSANVPGGVFYPPDPFYCECQCPDGMIQGHEPCPTKRLLAAVYSDHRDYLEEWKP